MKLITSLSMIFIFCIGVGLSNGQAVQDTPIMAKYRKYYEANENHLPFLMSMFNNECEDKCSNKDKMAIKNGVDSGDMLAIALNNGITSDDYYSKIEAGAKMGEPWSLHLLITSLYGKDIKKAEEYALFAKEKSYDFGYSALRVVYKKMKDDDKFCAVAQEDYSKKGVKAIAEYLIYRENRSSLFFTKCTKKTLDELIAIFGKEGQLMKGFALVREQKYEEAYKTFENVYREGDSAMVSANAGYCLGMMNYYGKGVKRDKDKGKKLLKESFHHGIVYEKTPEQKKYALPERADFQMYPYTKGICEDIK